MVLLYVDLLGMKARWQSAGVAGAKAAYQTLDLVIRHSLELMPEETAQGIRGGIQSDAAALVCPTVSDAVTAGILIFKETFRRCGSLDSGRERHWIRGVIVELGEAELEDTEALPGAAQRVEKRIFSDDLLEAINVEQSGFRGQRLLVAESLIDPVVEDRFRVPVMNEQSLALLSNLEYSNGRSGFRDVLWMFPSNDPPTDVDHSWQLMRRAMENRLRWAGEGGPGEFTQAAATQLVFAECNAIYRDLLPD
jgi:hypothetical protein